MSLIFWVVLKATLILVAGLAAVSSAGKARASVRHLILASTFAALLILPLVSLIAAPSVIKLQVLDPVKRAGLEGKAAHEQGRNAKGLTAMIDVSPYEESNPAATASFAVRRWSPSQLSAGIWGIGTTLLVAAFTAALFRLRTIRRRGMPWVVWKLWFLWQEWIYLCGWYGSRSEARST